MRRKLSRLQWAPMSLALGLAVLTMAQEFAKPADKRAWTGLVLGFVPYDFRPPTLERIKASLWNPDDPHLITGQVFGVGWSINLYQVAKRLGKTGASNG